MKKLLIVLLLACTTLFTGCFDMVEEVFLNKDGSGKYHITMDMSGMFNNPLMEGIMEEAMKIRPDSTNKRDTYTEEEDVAEPEETEPENPMDALLLEKDSVLYFKDMPQVEELSAEDKKVLGDALIRMTMSKAKKQMLIRVEYDFKKVDDITKINEVMQKVGSGQQLDLGGMPGGDFLNGQTALLSWQKGLLKRLPMKMDIPEELEESMGMLKMFMGNADYTTIYHLPGKVKKVSIPNASVEGNTVTINNSMMDFLEGKAKIDGQIKFK